MPFTRKVKFPLTNHVDVADLIAHSNLFESEYSRVGLVSISMDDEFGSSTQQDLKTGGDGVKSYGWNVLNSANADAIDVNITNAGRLTIDFNAVSSDTWNVFTCPFIYKNIAGAFDVSFAIAATNADQSYEGVGLFVRDPTASAGEDFLGITWFNTTSGTIKQLNNRNTVNSVSNDLNATNYIFPTYLRIVRNAADLTQFLMYYKNNPGDAWTYYATRTRTDFANSVQVGIAGFTVNTSNTYLLQIDYMYRLDDVNYPTTSPSPATTWTALKAGDVIDMSTAKVWMYKDGVVQAAGNTDVTFKYAANNGSDSAAKTLTQLRAETDVTVTNETNSFKVYGLYASDGAYKSESETWIEFNVVSADAAAGGGSYLLDGGLIR